MERRTFDKIIEEKVENAEYVVESAKEYNVVIPGLSEMEAVLKNPVEAVKEEVVDLANLAASVHEIGLPTEDPAVKRFAKEKLGMQPSEFGEIINDSNSGEEVQVRILEAMETPQEIIEEVTGKTTGKAK